MTDHRRFGDLELGHLGPLLYLPAQNPESGPGLLQTTRLHSTLRFEIIGSSAELYPPLKNDFHNDSSQLWRERQLQRRWLLNAHPEASMGNTCYQELLKQDMEHFAKADETTQRRPLLAFGLMTDVRGFVRKGMPVLASATGPSGETLRLTRVDETWWQWDHHDDAALNISVIDCGHQEEEATWNPDAVPILQVKAAIWASQFDSIRWILVQKSTSTTILQPEYRPSLMPNSQEDDSAIHHRSSFISPSPILTLKHDRTGGNAHSDVSFKPPALGQPPQLVILDECGYWSIWNIMGTWKVNKKTLRWSQYKCGHVSGGLLDSIPSHITPNAERHGLLHVGKSSEHSAVKEQEADEEKIFSESAEDLPPADSEPQYILMWNSKECKVADVESNIYLPTPELLSDPKRTTDQILDIQRSCLNEDHVFVLTSRRLIWMDVFGRDSALDSPGQPLVVLSCTHFGFGHHDMRMSVTRASAQDSNTSLVFTYSCTSGQLCVYWFTLAPGTGLPQWHRHVTRIPGTEGSASNADIVQLRVQPVELKNLAESSGNGPGSHYLQKEVDFYQVSILGKGLDVRYCICASTFDPALEISLPGTRMGWSKNERRQRWRKTRKYLQRHKEDIFVLPDGMGEIDLESALEETDAEVEMPPKAPKEEPSQEPRPAHVKMERISRAINRRMARFASQGEPSFPFAIFSSIRSLVKMWSDRGSLPLTTWADIAQGFGLALISASSDDDLEVEAEELFEMTDDQIVITQLRRHESTDAVNPALRLSIIKRQLSELWLEPTREIFSEELQGLRERWLSEVALDLLLSSYAVMVQNVPLLGHGGLPSQLSHERNLAATASQSSGFGPRITVSSPSEPASSAASAPASDSAFERLKLLAPSLEPGKLGELAQPNVLLYWPTRPGEDTRDYISSVAIASEERFSGAKERLRKKEAKRKAYAEHFKRPAFMRQGFPTSDGLGSSQREAVLPIRPPAAATQILSSQQVVPESSQSQAPWVTMSQPVSGAFGDRKKGKKGKRKSGFR
ncbi:hypothetical protein HIM_03415 [Hirsutella minnesotensis 3608]|uniref:RNA polymerase I-specific transcription initiation factor RRN6-like protein n=1 Tax=Hirsutella minnesotensis 3608 TaxID=1043627 RepID=A0A0F8A6H6_9HYPO|nr:hypothetical protein HIM_03415 [Hirsutella minnesotensis 3608]